MRFAIAILMALHGVAHLVGFLVPWGLVEPDGGVRPTALLAGRIDASPGLLKGVGIVWLLLSLAFVATSIGAGLDRAGWTTAALGVAAASLIWSVVGWPDARIGVAVNAALILAIVAGRRLGWI